MFLFRCCFWTTRERTPVTHPLTSHSDSWVEVWDRPWKSCQPKSWESQCSRENTTQWVIHGKTNGEKNHQICWESLCSRKKTTWKVNNNWKRKIFDLDFFRTVQDNPFRGGVEPQPLNHLEGVNPFGPGWHCCCYVTVIQLSVVAMT